MTKSPSPSAPSIEQPRPSGAAKDTAADRSKVDPSATGLGGGPTLSIAQAWIVAAVLVAAGFAALTIDLPVARWVAGGGPPGAVRKLANLAEVFAHGFGIIMILVTIYTLDPLRRRAIPRLAAAGLGAGIMANVLKMLVARWRPHSFDLEQEITASFIQWLPLISAGSRGQSVPSGHTAAAFGLAMVLIWLYPRGRWLFLAFAVLAASQRVLSNDHYVSDTLWGAALGCIVGTTCVGGTWLAGRLARFESKTTARQTAT